MAKVMTSYMPTAGAAVTRAADSLSWTLSTLPRSMTVYIRFIERGSVVMASSPRLWHLGSGTNNPRLFANGQGTYYQASIITTYTSRASTLAVAPALGQVVEIRTTLTDAGVIQIHQTINHGTEVSATAASAITLPPAWAGTTFTVNADIASRTGAMGLMNLAVMAGVQSRATMREKAGV